MEEQGKTKKSIANLICMIASSVTCVVFGIIVIVMLFEVHDVKKQLASQGEEIVALKSAHSSEIDVSFSDGYEPGATFHIMLNPDTDTLIFEEVNGCSLPADECDSLNLHSVKWAVLNPREYYLVKESYEGVKTIINKTAAHEESNDEKRKLLRWTTALMYLVNPNNNEEVVGDPTMEDWEEIKVQDSDGDGVVSEREYAIHTLADIANYDLSESAE